MTKIVLKQNNITSINVGASIIFNRCKILNNSSNDDSSLNQQLIKLNNKYNSDYKNKIILNIVFSDNETYCLLTKNNIKNNMKFLFDSDNKKMVSFYLSQIKTRVTIVIIFYLTNYLTLLRQVKPAKSPSYSI